eukprot:scaffold176269_cov72-Attheya_sp.AAC.1
MTPSPLPAGDHPSSSKKKFLFRLEARNAGVGAYHVHVIPISDESNNNNNNDSQVEPSETATVENTVSRVEVSDNEAIVNQHEVSDGETIEEARVERAASSTTSIRVRDAYLESIKCKSSVCLSTLFVSAIAAIVFTIFYNRGDDGGNREFSRGTAGSPTASPTEMNHYYCDETRLLPAIDSKTIATRTDRFQALQSVLETELVDYDPTAFDDPCGPHNFALQWLADEDGLQLEPDAMEAVYQRFVVALFYFSTNMYSTHLASHSNQVHFSTNMYSTHLASHSNQVQSPWLSAEPECTWFGITCRNMQIFDTNKIISIELPSSHLKGSIPNALVFHLDSLEELDLGWNVLTGTIPTESGTLPNLIKLYLNDNHLEGTIPSEIGQITTLAQISNDLRGRLPFELFSLTNLRLLNLSFNKISGVLPIDIKKLENYSSTRPKQANRAAYLWTKYTDEP